MIEKNLNKSSIPPVFLAVLALVLLFISYNVYVLLSPSLANQQPPFNSSSSNQTLGAILLTAPTCTACFSLEGLATALFPNRFDIVSYADQKGKDLATKYSIAKLPSLIIFDASKVQDPQIKPLLVTRQDALVLESPAPPYVDVATGEVKGIVASFSISPTNCSQCVKASDFINEVNGNEVAIQNQELNADSTKALELIAKYNLTFLPAFIFSEDLLEYGQFKQSWSSLGSVETDGNLIMRQPLPPYVNLSNDKIEGLVNATYLTYQNCSVCYNVSIHRAAMQNYNVYLVNESYVDVASLEGQALIERYNVTKVPTLLLSREISVYVPLAKVWGRIGSVEEDGTFIFRNFNTVPGITYWDLINSSAVKVSGAS
ncbi:MAG: hypothetical protein Q8R15_03805 [Candidatus Micrarchaeota archaeon]|nr:hypothetical protein [Candidatus Micrarchaeota archaeon]